MVSNPTSTAKLHISNGSYIQMINCNGNFDTLDFDPKKTSNNSSAGCNGKRTANSSQQHPDLPPTDQGGKRKWRDDSLLMVGSWVDDQRLVRNT
ncbi:hypothetical protein PG991_006337 [Apiospora marii]|uniref:Uncharacterized protein n=1 Tax=Apiospora marii TaxID=335849 RepID=A0ABR1SC18_9PEZI